MKDIQMNKTSEPPRRYLPEICDQCRYKLFCEKECTDECPSCNYKKYANEHGVEFSHKTQLSIEKEIEPVIKEKESEIIKEEDE